MLFKQTQKWSILGLGGEILPGLLVLVKFYLQALKWIIVYQVSILTP